MGVQLVTGYGGKPHITPKQTALFNAGIITDDDYVLNTGNMLEARILSANELSIGTGDVVMQGRHITCPDPTTISIPSGTTGYNRIDLIVLRYEKDPNTGIEDVNWVVLSGVPTEGKALDPTYIHQDILEENNISNDLPVYRVEINGMVPKEPELLLPVLRSLESVIEELASYGTIVSHDAWAEGENNAGAVPLLNAAGLLPISLGGTGMATNPSLLVNLGSASAANVLQASPRPGVTGTLPVARGGTGQTSLQATRNAMGLGNTTGVLPIANGGTGTNSSDPVIASGTSGNWHYVKFNSGLAICSFKKNYTISTSTQWNNIYTGSQIKPDNYPFAFTAIPATVAMIYSDGFKQFWASGIDNGSTTVPPCIHPSSDSSKTNVSVYVCLIAIGRWK